MVNPSHALFVFPISPRTRMAKHFKIEDLLVGDDEQVGIIHNVKPY